MQISWSSICLVYAQFAFLGHESIWPRLSPQKTAGNVQFYSLYFCSFLVGDQSGWVALYRQLSPGNLTWNQLLPGTGPDHTRWHHIRFHFNTNVKYKNKLFKNITLKIQAFRQERGFFKFYFTVNTNPTSTQLACLSRRAFSARWWIYTD